MTDLHSRRARIETHPHDERNARILLEQENHAVRAENRELHARVNELRLALLMATRRRPYGQDRSASSR